MKKYPDWLKIKECKVIQTYDLTKTNNGYLIDILNINDTIMSERKDENFSQFYMTTVLKHFFKGLHVHPYKTDTLFCAHGKICLVIYTEPVEKDFLGSLNLDKFIFIEMGVDNYKTVSLPAKYPHGYFGISENSIIINYRNPAWTPEDKFQYDIHDAKLLSELKKRYGEEK